LLYWTTLVYLVGVPNFVHFDTTGRTGNALNLTSISTIVLACIAGYVLTLVLLFDSRPLMARKIDIKIWLWVALLVELLIAVALHPSSRLTPPSALGPLLSCFRLGQWVVAFGLIAALYTRTAPEQANRLVVQLIGRASWIWLGLVWTILPIMPSQVFAGSEEDEASATRRLGGQLLHPAHVAFLSSAAFFYALFFFRRGPLKWIACTFALATLVLTGARAQQAGFALTLLLYTIVLTRKPAIRWGAIFAGLMAVPVGLSMSDLLVKFVRRGQSVQSLTSLNDRTRVWMASFEAIAKRPIIGYGYSVGARSAIRDYWKYAHWIPPHAHNEFIEIALDGGIVALAILLFLYGLVLWNAMRAARRSPRHLFLFLVFAQFCMNTVTGSEFSYQYLGTGGILLLTCIAVLADRPSRVDWRQSSSPRDRGRLSAPLQVSVV